MKWFKRRKRKRKRKDVKKIMQTKKKIKDSNSE